MSETSSAAVRIGRGSRGEAERLVREFEQSGMGRKEYCEARGIAPHRLDYCRRRYGSGFSPSMGQLVPVELVEGYPSQGSRLRVELANGRRIAVEEGFDAMLLKRLAAALEN